MRFLSMKSVPLTTKLSVWFLLIHRSWWVMARCTWYNLYMYFLIKVMTCYMYGSEVYSRCTWYNLYMYFLIKVVTCYMYGSEVYSRCTWYNLYMYFLIKVVTCHMYGSEVYSRCTWYNLYVLLDKGCDLLHVWFWGLLQVFLLFIRWFSTKSMWFFFI